MASIIQYGNYTIHYWYCEDCDESGDFDTEAQAKAAGEEHTCNVQS